MFLIPMMACLLSPPVTVTVVAPDGAPAVGVKVWAFRYQESGPPLPEPPPVTTDGTGKVTLSWGGGVATQTVHFFALDPSGRLGSLVTGRVTGEPVVLKLLEVSDRTGRVLDGDGKPITGAGVTVTAAFRERGRIGRYPNYQQVSVPDWESARRSVRTDADGRFTLKNLPVGYSLHLLVNAGDRGEVKFYTRTEGELVAAFPHPGRVAVTVRGADPAVLKGLELSVHSIDRPGEDAPGTHPMPVVRTQHDGTAGFVIPNAFPGRSYFNIRNPHPHPFVFARVDMMQVKAGETTPVTLTLSPAAKISGKITDPAGNGLANCYVRAIVETKKDEYSQHLESVFTDADGTFTTHGPAGAYSLYVSTAPAGFAKPILNRGDRFFEPVPVEVGQAITLPPVKLIPAVEFVAKVEDSAGKPLVGADVAFPHTERRSEREDRDPIDANGVLRVNNLHPNDSISPRIRRGKAVNVPQVYAAGNAATPVTIEVSEANAVTVAGKVTTGAGAGVPGAKVELTQIIWGFGRSSMSSSHSPIETVRSDAEGRFRFGALWAGDQYQVKVTADGYADAEVPPFSVTAGQVTDVPAIKLMNAKMSIAGVIVDTAGKPVAGARVFAVEGLKPMEAKSAADGTYTLTGFYDAPGFLFAEAPDFRLIALPVQPRDKAPVRVVLRRTSEPPQQIVIPKDHTDADRRLTRHVLEAIYKNFRADGYSANGTAGMAKFDPETAQQWVLEELDRTAGKTDWSGIIRKAERQKTLLPAAKANVSDAVKTLEKLSATAGYDESVQLAVQLLPDDKAKALRVLEVAVAKARTHHWQVSSLARAGELIARAGDPALAKTVIEEAMTLAEKIPAVGRDRDVWEVAAAAARMAPYDWPRAKRTIDSIKDDYERAKCLASAAVQFAPTDLAKAKETLKLIEPNKIAFAHEGMARVATRIARTDPDGAIKLVEGIPDQTYQIRGYAQIARAVAGADKPRAVALLDRAMKVITDKPDGRGLWVRNGGASYAVYVAMTGQRIGHPDVAGLTARALALRGGPPNPYERAAERNENLIRLATGFGLLDPAIGRHLLGTIAPPDEFVKLAIREQREWMFALAVCDPERAVPVVDARAKYGRSQSGVVELGSALAETDRLSSVGGWCHLVADIYEGQ